MTVKDSDGCGPECFLVVEDPEQPSTWHLQVRDPDGTPNHRLMGAAWAALTVGYRGNRYQGPQKQQAMAKLKALYRAEGMDTPTANMSTDPSLDDDIAAILNGVLREAISDAGDDDGEPPAVFSVEMPPGTDDDGFVVRTGKLFEVGTYPDKAFSFDGADLDRAVTGFTSAPVRLEHVKTILDGKLGRVEAIWKGEDGKSLMGRVRLPAWLNALSPDAIKVSPEFRRSDKALVRLGLTLAPRVDDAALVAAFSASTGHSVEDTLIGLIRDRAAEQAQINRAVAQALTGRTGTAGTPPPATFTRRKVSMSTIRDWLLGKAREDGMDPDPTELDALFSTAPDVSAAIQTAMAAKDQEIAALRAEQERQTATFSRLADERRITQARAAADALVAANKLPPGAVDAFVSLANRLAASDEVATFSQGEEPSLALLGKLVEQLPDLALFTQPTVDGSDQFAALLATTTTPGKGTEVRADMVDKALAATPGGREVLKRRQAAQNGKGA